MNRQGSGKMFERCRMIGVWRWYCGTQERVAAAAAHITYLSLILGGFVL